MNLLLLLRAAARAWLTVMAGMLGTAAVLVIVWSTPGVYYAQADVVFLRPTHSSVPNALSVTSSSVIATAGVVERLVNAGPAAPRVASTNVSLVGEGVRRGTSVELPNSGGQWANNFDQAKLHVQVVDYSPGETRSRLVEVTARINELLAERQAASGAAPETWIRTQLSPEEPPVVQLSGDRRRASLAVLVLGGGATCAAVVLLATRRLVPPGSSAHSPLDSPPVSDRPVRM